MAECQERTRPSRSRSRSRKNSVAKHDTQDGNMKEEPRMKIVPDTFIKIQDSNTITSQKRLSPEDISKQSNGKQHSETQMTDYEVSDNEISSSDSWVTGRGAEVESSLSSEDTLDKNVLDISKLNISLSSEERSPKGAVAESCPVISFPVISQEIKDAENQASEDNHLIRAEEEDVENKDPLKIGATVEAKDALKIGATVEAKDALKIGATVETKDALKIGATVETKDALKIGATVETKDALKIGATVETKDALKTGATEENKTSDTAVEKKQNDSHESCVISKDVKIKQKFQLKQPAEDKSKTVARSSLCDAISFFPLSRRRETEETEDTTAPIHITHPQKASPWSCTGKLTELGDMRFKENRDKEPHSLGRNCIPHRYNISKNIFYAVTNATFGRTTSQNKWAVSSQIASNIANFEVVDCDYPFGTRFTTLDWHPRKRNTLLACSNQGDVAVYTVGTGDYAALSAVETFPGVGPGGAITDLKFHPTEDHLFFTSSMCGKISLKDITGRSNKILLDQCHWLHWFSAVEAHQTDRLVLGGQSNGYVNLLTREGEPIWEKQLHVQEITSISFSPRDPALFITSSTDRTVRLWDIRKVENRKPVELLFHKKGISSACFSATDGNRLLTTDLQDEIRVYKSPLWRMERSIQHPHKNSQHRTAIKASWHPHRDMIVCGRNPDKAYSQYSDSRCIDIFDAVSGKWLGETKDTLYDGIPSLSKVNQDGDKLAIVMGYNVTLWNNEATFAYHELSKSQMDKFTKSRHKVAENVRMRGRDDSIERRKRKDGKSEKLKEAETEMESETETEVEEEREFVPQFVQHIGGGRLRINMANMRPRNRNSSAQAQSNEERGRMEAPVVNVANDTRDSGSEMTNGASAPNLGSFTENSSLQNRGGNEEILMDEIHGHQEDIQAPEEDSRARRENVRERRLGFFSRLFGTKKR